MQNAAFSCGVIAVLALGVSAAFAESNRHKIGSSNISDASRNHQETAEQTWPWPNTWQARHAVIPEQRPDTASDHQNSDEQLAQHRSPDDYSRRGTEAAEKQADVAAKQYPVEIIGAAVSALAAVFTALAALEAGRAATAAKTSADVAKSALTDIERAFVFCTHQEIVRPIDIQKGMFAVSFKFSNMGKTWTKNCRNYMSWKSFNEPMPDDFDFSDQEPIREQPWAKRDPGTAFVGPGGAINLGPVMIPSRYIIDALEGKKHVYVWAWCEYDDIFQDTKRHRTEFCVKVQPLHATVQSEDGAKSVSVALMHHSTYNGADDDCLKPLQTGSPKNPLARE
ncbi:MAG: hypothetical protein WC689_08935 [Methylocystis sp.]